MKHLGDAWAEYKKTSPILKPLLCLDPKTGLYVVTLAFSKTFCQTKGLEVVHG